MSAVILSGKLCLMFTTKSVNFFAYFDLLRVNLIEILPGKYLHLHFHTHKVTRTHARTHQKDNMWARVPIRIILKAR